MQFPLFIDLAERPCLVVGSGRAARQKTEVLSACGATVTVVETGTDGRAFADSDAEGMAVVVAATDDRAVNAHVSEVCRAKGILVNVVDAPELCTFFFPAVFRKGPITAAVSSDGTCPVAAQIVRDRIGALVEDDFVEAVERLGRERAELKARFPDTAARKRYYEEELSKWRG